MAAARRLLWAPATNTWITTISGSIPRTTTTTWWAAMAVCMKATTARPPGCSRPTFPPDSSMTSRSPRTGLSTKSMAARRITTASAATPGRKTPRSPTPIASSPMAATGSTRASTPRTPTPSTPTCRTAPWCASTGAPVSASPSSHSRPRATPPCAGTGMPRSL